MEAMISICYAFSGETGSLVTESRSSLYAAASPAINRHYHSGPQQLLPAGGRAVLCVCVCVYVFLFMC